MKIFLLIVTLGLIGCVEGCSLVQYMPSSDCEKVEYKRVGNKASVKAEDCAV